MSPHSTQRARVIALAASLLALARPALADQFKESADGGTIQCSVSARELTRFALIGDQFASVSKISSGYGARLYDATRSLRISDPEFAANLDEHFRQCVFYDVLLGRYSMKQLAESSDIWTTIAPGSQARAQRFLTRDAGGQVTSTIIACREAYDALNTQWSGLIDSMGTVFGRQLYPNQTAALAKAKLFADLPVAYQYLTGVSASATDLFKQTLTINAMSQAMHGMSAASGAGSVDVYAQTRADIQTERTYSSIANAAMKWVPLLNVVLTVLFYALFPVLFPLFLLPKTGPSALKGYVTGFFYLAAWGPLFVILHMMLMYKGAADMAAVAGTNGLSLATFTGMADVNSDIGLLAGYLIASVPFLAGGVAKGAMAISHQATSYLNPSQNAAEEAAREASTGNVALGNTSLENSTVMTRQFAQGTIAPSFTYGAAQTRTISDSGSQTTSYPEAAYDQLPNSSYPFTPTLGRDFSSRLSTMASDYHANSQAKSALAQQSTISSISQFRELRDQTNSGQSIETASGTSSSDSVQTAYSEVDQASNVLQQKYGLSRRAADDITVSWFLNGEASAGVGGNFGPATLSAGAKGGRNQSWTDSDIGIASEDRDKISGTLRQISDSHNWTSTRDGFLRTVSTSTNSRVRSTATGLNASLTETRRCLSRGLRYDNPDIFDDSGFAATVMRFMESLRAEQIKVEEERHPDHIKLEVSPALVGADFGRQIESCDAWVFNCDDEIEAEDQAEAANLFDNLQDYGDIWSELPHSGRVKAQGSFSEMPVGACGPIKLSAGSSLCPPQPIKRRCRSLSTT